MNIFSASLCGRSEIEMELSNSKDRRVHCSYDSDIQILTVSKVSDSLPSQ